MPPFGVLPVKLPDPSDLTDQYNTPLSPEQARAYEAWKATLPPQLQSVRDYDLQGAFLADAKAAANGHLPDTFKKPNHPTFSSGSKYSNPQDQGGEWVDLGGGNWAFRATPDNFRFQTPDMLAAYMAQVEPGSRLSMPKDGALGRMARKPFGRK